MKILIIEDDAGITHFLKRNLEAEYFTVSSAVDGNEGLALAKHSSYGVIILDYILPGKSGLQVCKELRADGNHTPVLLLSVKTDTSTKIDVLNCGADDYLTKPFSFEELVARIRALIRRPGQTQGDILSLADLKLDLLTHVVTRGEKSIQLTRKEFMLLEFFMRNNGKVLSRASILEHVWDINADPFSNTIETHVLSLRRKIWDKRQKPLIRTVAGVGYKIEMTA